MTTTQKKLSWQSFSTTHPAVPDSLRVLHSELRSFGCSSCPLGAQEGLHGPVLYRGKIGAKIMVIAEAAGKNEDLEGKPLIGPAGKKLDQIFSCAGISTDNDCYLTNTVLCRPLAAKGSGKENLAPKKEHIAACRPWLLYQISIVKPRIIVLLGNVALNLSPEITELGTITRVMGKKLRCSEFPGIVIFPMLHPSAILRAEYASSEQARLYKTATWEHVQELRRMLDVYSTEEQAG